MKFIDIDPSEVDTSRSGRRGRIAYPIVKAFIERNVKMCKLDVEGTKYKLVSLRANLHSYVTRHEMPVQVFQAGGDLHMMRLDIDNEGNPIENWATAGEEPIPIGKENIQERAEKDGAWKE